MSTSPFIRNQFTLSAYVLLGFYAYMQTSLGPIMPFIRAELSLNYTVTGFHVTGFALGMVIAGITGASMAQRFGRKLLFWGAGLGMVSGGILLSLAQIAPLTILGTFMLGWLGTYLLVMIQSTLADEHGENRAIALTESNIVASILAAIVPIVVGIGAGTVLTWRVAIVLGAGLWLTMFVINRTMSFPTTKIDKTDNTSNTQLPNLFWWYWIVIFLCVALEWCVLFWSADFLNTVVGLPTEQAASILSVFLVAMIIGRVLGSRLTYRYAPQNLLWLAISLIIVGFPLFWLGQVAWLNILGLFIVGLGISNLFPLGLSIASRVGENASDLASSRISLAAGLAILIIPQVLGSTADVIGIFNAFMIVPLFITMLVVMLAIANRKFKHKTADI